MAAAVPPDAPAVFDRLCTAAMRQGCRLFTITAADADLTTFDRRYTSHPAEYPVSGTKPIERDAWYEHVITRRQSFVANTPAEFEKLFFDHALITSMGLGSCLNIPLNAGGRVLGTVNFLAGAQHFTPQRLAAYHAMTDAEAADLARQLGGD
jgi:GAF domain-containing protein